MFNIPPYAIWGLLSAAVIAGVFYFARVSRDKHNAKLAEEKKREEEKQAEIKRQEAEQVAEARQRNAETAHWRKGFREIVVELRTQMELGEIPSDWFGTYERAIPILCRVATTMPKNME